MPKVITAYQCLYCGRKIYKHQASAIKHEGICPWRKGNRACATCGNRVVSQVEISPGHYRDGYTCSVYQIDLGDRANLRMKCSGWDKAGRHHEVVD